MLEYIILGKNSDGLMARVFGLHCEKVAVQGLRQTYHKLKFWYDGPDHIVSNISSVDRDKCVEETQKCKKEWLKAWQTEDCRWKPELAELTW